MATEAHRATPLRETDTAAPRFSAPRGSLAAADERLQRQEEDRRSSGDPRSIYQHETVDLGLMSYGDEAEDARNMLGEAASLVQLLAFMHDDAQTLRQHDDRSEASLRQPKVVARALEGVARLICLADFAVQRSMETRS